LSSADTRHEGSSTASVSASRRTRRLYGNAAVFLDDTPRGPKARMKTWLMAALALLVGCDGGVNGPMSAPDGGPGDAGPDAPAGARQLSAGTEVVDFGCVGLDKPVAYQVLVKNTGQIPVGPLEVGLAPSTSMLLILTDGCGGLTLGRAESCAVSIFFMAAAPLEAEATLQVTAPGTASLRLPVRAESSPLGDRPDTERVPFDFGVVRIGSATPSMGLQLRNIGDQTSTVPAAALARGEAFEITADNCSGRAVPPMGGCGVSVRFAPKTGGQHTDQLRLGPGRACDPFPPVPLLGTAN
jgi:hypothetical protein